MGASAQPHLATYVTLGMVALVVLLRLRRAGRRRRLRLETLWIGPAILVAILALTFVGGRPSPLALGLSSLALLIGGLIGWQRGRMIRIELDPETHELNQQASPAAILLLLALIALRFGARALVESGALPMHVNPTVVVDVLLSFAVGLFAVTRIEMFLRARRLLDGAGRD